ncbi:nuclease-related domain-containing protein [Pseudoneobacillus sp. C159]
MFLNERQCPIKIQQIKAILRRIPKNHRKRLLLENELNRLNAGLWGEREVDKKLQRMDQDKYLIICGLRLPNGDGTFFQIDTIVISTRFILVIESKNIAGILYFDLINHQFYRMTDDGKREVFSDPVSQARMHVQQLRRWFLRHKFPPTVLDFLVVSTNPYSHYQVSHPENPCAKKICSVAGLTWKIDDYEELHTKEFLTEKEIRQMGKALIKAHTPLQPSDILPQYGLSDADVPTGVQCPDCEFIPLIYQNGKWYCQICNIPYKDAHIYSLHDRFLLLGVKITNSEFRQFVHLRDSDTATKLLRKMNLNVTGTTRNRVYEKVFFE